MPETTEIALSVKDGDVILVKTDDLLTEDRLNEIMAQAKKAFPNNKCLILQGGMDIALVRKEDIEALKKVIKES